MIIGRNWGKRKGYTTAEVATNHGRSGRWGSRENTEESWVGYQFGKGKWDRGEKSLFLLMLQTLQWGLALAGVFSSKRGHRP